MTKSDKKMHLPEIADDLFTTQEEREKVAVVRSIKIENIVDFPNHPFKVRQDENLNKMVESINEMGVVNPIIVRPAVGGKYEIISGHRRKFASVIANKIEIPAIVKNLTDDEATILMVDSNIQREELLPSEKAFAYKMKMDALKHQGLRNDLTSCPMDTKLQSAETVANDSEDSTRQIFRYIRLTELIPELLDKVDEKIIAFRPAVEISYLTVDEQKMLLDSIDCNQATPSLSQAQTLKRLSQNKTLNEEQIYEILEQGKPNQTMVRAKISQDKLKTILPNTIKGDLVEDYVLKAVDFYNRYQKKIRDEKSR